ncbi:MAG: hypothetical protein SWO11_21545 [Thermodesulfobacteriota bacterium]|nr:hypothetical protein [Thermodesulfobacteriota bacterium]
MKIYKKGLFLILAVIFCLGLAGTAMAGGSKGSYRIDITVSGSSVYPNTFTVAKHDAVADYVYLGDKWIDGYFWFSFTTIGGVTTASTTGISVYCQDVMHNTDAAWAVAGVSYIMTNVDAWSGATRVKVYCAPTGGEYYRIGFYTGNTCAPTGTLSIR